MKILIVSTDSVGPLAVVYRLSKEGHDVRWFSFSDSNIGRGLVDKPDGWRSEIGAADLVVCMGRPLAPVVSAAQSLGKHILGSSSLCDISSKELAADTDIPLLLATQLFNEDVAATMQGWKNEGLFVSQQEDDWPNFTWECKTKEDYAYVVQKQIDGNGHLVQDRKEGVAVSVIGWWNGRKWLKPFHLHWRADVRARYSSGMLAVIDNQETLNKVIIPLKGVLKKDTYKGPVCVDCIMDAQGNAHVMNIELSLRADYFSLLAEGAFQGMADLLFETAAGTATGIRYHPEYVVGDVLRGYAIYGAPVNGLNEFNLKHIAFVGVRGDEKYVYVSENYSPILMVMARGETIREAGRRVARSTMNLSILRVQTEGRAKVDAVAEKQLGKLLNWRHI